MVGRPREAAVRGPCASPYSSIAASQHMHAHIRCPAPPARWFIHLASTRRNGKVHEERSYCTAIDDWLPSDAPAATSSGGIYDVRSFMHWFMYIIGLYTRRCCRQEAPSSHVGLCSWLQTHPHPHDGVHSMTSAHQALTDCIDPYRQHLTPRSAAFDSRPVDNSPSRHRFQRTSPSE